MKIGSEKSRCRLATCVALLAAAGTAFADGIVVDRVYDPYVQPLETEVEWRTIVQSDDDVPDIQKHSLGIGRSLSDRWGIEFYAIGTRNRGEHLSIDVFELELKRQLTEQGEYAIDWGVIFELERDVDQNIWEASAALLAARDFGRWSGLVNVGLLYEWGSGVGDEVETELHAQARYRYKETVEPAVELHVGQDTAVIGPVLTGLYRVSPGKKLRWDLGVFFAANERSPDQVVKLNLEYEF